MKTRNRLQRGVAILENLIAMTVVLVGAAGVAAVQRQSTFFLGDARRLTRAATFAGDLVSQIQLWDFDDPRLANTLTGNDLDVGDSTNQFQLLDDPPDDHGEADLTLGGKTWTGLPQELLVANGMERYWNVSLDNVDSNGNGIPDAIRLAVIVRWQTGGGWRRIVIPTVKLNPAERL